MKDVLLMPLSWLFGALVALKNLCYDRGWLRVQRLPRPVISVGNLAMGGTGKSPVVQHLVAGLQVRGLRVAVLSRGYGRREAKRCRLVDPSGDWSLYGDEPTMLARACPGVRVCVGPSRYEAAQLLADDWPDVFVVDDGFQHRQLARDLDLVLLDTGQPAPRLFPRGLFREAWSALRRADLVLLTRCEGGPQTAWRHQVAAVTGVPVLESSFRTGPARLLASGESLDLDTIPGRRVAAYAAIAQPEKFRNSLKQAGFDVVVWESFPDHGILSQVARNKLFEAMRRAGVRHLLTTEKDAVKLEQSPDSDILLCSLPLILSMRSGDLMTCVIDRVNKVAP